METTPTFSGIFQLKVSSKVVFLMSSVIGGTISDYLRPVYTTVTRQIARKMVEKSHNRTFSGFSANFRGSPGQADEVTKEIPSSSTTMILRKFARL